MELTRFPSSSPQSWLCGSLPLPWLGFTTLQNIIHLFSKHFHPDISFFSSRTMENMVGLCLAALCYVSQVHIYCPFPSQVFWCITIIQFYFTLGKAPMNWFIELSTSNVGRGFQSDNSNLDSKAVYAHTKSNILSHVLDEL